MFKPGPRPPYLHHQHCTSPWRENPTNKLIHIITTVPLSKVPFRADLIIFNPTVMGASIFTSVQMDNSVPLLILINKTLVHERRMFQPWRTNLDIETFQHFHY